jgi:hypothetical protein
VQETRGEHACRYAQACTRMNMALKHGRGMHASRGCMRAYLQTHADMILFVQPTCTALRRMPHVMALSAVGLTGSKLLPPGPTAAAPDCHPTPTPRTTPCWARTRWSGSPLHSHTL